MYGWLWRALPGPTPVRVALAALLVLAAVVVLFTVVFPAVAPLLPVNDGTVDGAARAGALAGWPSPGPVARPPLAA